MLTTWVVIWQRVALTIYPHIFSSTRHGVVPTNQNIWIGTSYLEGTNCCEDRSDKQRMRNSCVTKYCDTSDIERENDTPHPSQHLHGEMPNAVIRNIAKWIDIRIHYSVVGVYKRLFHLIAPCVSLCTLYRVSGTTHERRFIDLRFLVAFDVGEAKTTVLRQLFQHLSSIKHHSSRCISSTRSRCAVAASLTMCGAMEDEFSDGYICGVWVYVGDAQNPIVQARTRQQSDDAIGEDMKSWDTICKAVNVTYEQTQQVDETAKIVGVSRWEVLEALGFSDEWELTHAFA